MSTISDDPHARLRRSVYLLLIVLGAGAMLGRILAVDAVDQTAIQEHRIRGELKKEEESLRGRGLDEDRIERALEAKEDRLRKAIRLRRPFLSGNDRSRWCAVRALVEPEMRVEGAPYAIDKVVQEPTWDTIDLVKHSRCYDGPDKDTHQSAGDVIADWDGRQVGGHLYSSKQPLLSTLMAGEYWLIHRLTGATLGTHPFEIGRFMLVTMNLVPLVICFLLLARLVERFGTTDWGRMFVMAAAVFGTFLTTFSVTVNNHLPAAVSVLITIYAVVPIWCDGERRLRYFAVAGLFGAFTVANEMPAVALVAVISLALLWKAPRQTLLAYVPAALLVAAGFFGTNWIAHKSLVPPILHRGGGGPNDWYDYEYMRRTGKGDGIVLQSYWSDPAGVDKGEPSWPVYAMNVIVGHHGIFSLTPIWLLSVAGLAMWSWQRRDRPLRELALLIGAVSLLCLAFYLQPQKGSDYRNYGGMTSGLRWMFWFAPLWLLAMLPAVDWMAARRWTRGVALLLLAISVVSASYPTWNPWTHPWLMDYFHCLGWA